MKDVLSLIHNSGELENRQEIVVLGVFKVFSSLFLAPQISLGGLHELARMGVKLDDTVQDDPREAEEVGCLRQLCLFYSCFTVYF